MRGTGSAGQARELVTWTAVGLAGALLLAWACPRLLPLIPGEWRISRSQAEVIARERLRDLGDPVADSYVVTRLRSDSQLERRLQLLAGEGDGEVSREALRTSELAKAQLHWDIQVYPRGATAWTYQAWISLDGEVLSLRRNDPENGDGGEAEEAVTPDDADARRRGLEYLAAEGYDLAAFAGEGEIRDGASQTASVVRFRRSPAALADALPHGVEVHFDGGEIRGFGPWYEDPDRDELQSTFRQIGLSGFARTVMPYLLLTLVAVPFLRRYHDGQLGVRRGMHFFLLTLAAGIVFIAVAGESISSGTSIGLASRRQVTWMVAGFFLVFQFLGLAVLALMSWSVGESLCRRRWPEKLASIDALFRLKWDNATVARSALRGLAAGTLMAGVLFALSVAAQRFDAWPLSAFLVTGSGLDSVLPGAAALFGILCFFVPVYLFTCLLVPAWAIGRFGPAGLAVAILGAIVVAPLFVVLPLDWAWLLWAIVAAVPVLLFRYGDFLSALLAGLAAGTLVSVAPALVAQHPIFPANGYAALLVLAAPLIVSIRHLGSGREFVYTYDDVPPHVRRIAERERQRVELETARNIQSSILPQLPAQLHGVEIAHSYLPATEVGGDFYDVLALEDGRLAVAVGDVAGHGVSSGLVMSMAKSALAVQVTFDPAVEAVLTRLNRMVYQSARRRLLSTLVYAVLDPRERELYYASAGHVFPYRVSPEGEVEPLQAESYPLGVRGAIDVRVRTSKLAPGDAIFLYSDGLVEATPEASDEPFGFERLEASLGRHAAKPPGEMRDAVLADVEAYTGEHPREDDLTVLVLRLPAA